MRRPLNATATGQLDAGRGTISGACLCGGADAATAVIRSGGASGTILGKIGVGAGLSAVWNPGGGDAVVDYTDLHVTITGTTPQFTAYV